MKIVNTENKLKKILKQKHHSYLQYCENSHTIKYICRINSIPVSISKVFYTEIVKHHKIPVQVEKSKQLTLCLYN